MYVCVWRCTCACEGVCEGVKVCICVCVHMHAWTHARMRACVRACMDVYGNRNSQMEGIFTVQFIVLMFFNTHIRYRSNGVRFSHSNLTSPELNSEVDDFKLFMGILIYSRTQPSRLSPKILMNSSHEHLSRSSQYSS